MVKTRIFLEESDPLRQFQLAGGGSCGKENAWRPRVFGSPPIVCLGQEGAQPWPPVCVRVCVKLAGAMQSIFRSYGGSFQSVWQLGKELGRKSQIIVI